MKDMKLSAAEAKETMLCCDESDGPKYPYGLSLSLDEVSLDKLGIETLPTVGSEVMIMAKAKVTGVSVNENQDNDKRKSVSLQITELDVPIGGERTAENVLYGKG